MNELKQSAATISDASHSPDAIRTSDPPLLAPAAAVAAITLGQAIQVERGHVHPLAIALLTAALVAIGYAVATRRPVEPRLASRATLWILGAGLLLQVIELLIASPAINLTDYSARGLRPFRIGVILVGVAAAAAVVLAPRRRVGWLALGAMLMAHYALGAWIIAHAPHPHIDVYVIHRDSLDGLLAGVDPYTVHSPLIYSSTQMYGPGQVEGGRLTFGYPYMPLTLLASLPGHLVGDYRYAQLAAMTLTAALIAWSGVRRVPKVQLRRIPVAAAALLLLTPRIFYVIEHGWTDPFVGLCLALFVFLIARGRSMQSRSDRPQPGHRIGHGIAYGLLVAAKQYTVFFLLLVYLILDRRRGRIDRRATLRFLLVAAAAALAITLPLALWHLRDFTWSVLILQFHSPFRPDALSYPAFVALLGGPHLPSLIGFATAIPTTALALARAPRTAAGFGAASALVYLAFFAFNKQAFCNYYFFVIAALCVTVGAARVEDNAPKPAIDANRLSG